MTPSARPVAALWLLVGLQAAVSAASLVVEIVAGRMIAPYVGMSLYTWTAIIAVVLAGFSVGHWWGGRIAAKRFDAALRITGWTLVGAAVTTAAATLLLRTVAGPVLETLENPLAAITALTSLVFFLPSLFAGVPAPVLAVAAMRRQSGGEQALGAMFAAGAVGAIAGTLLAGFLFISWLGSVMTLALITAVYSVAALICFRLGAVALSRIAAPIMALVIAIGVSGYGAALPSACDEESRYYCIRTVDLSGDPADPVRLMVIDHLAHGVSARAAPRVMFTDHTAMLDALPRMRMAGRNFSSFHIGGGSYSVPRAWADRGLSQITVAEIDPAVTRIAKDDFWFEDAVVKVVHKDARIALKTDPTRYDVIIGDAFTDIAVPAHLVTLEFFELVASRLSPGGVYVMNLVDHSDRLDTLSALVATLGEVFPSVEVWTEARPPGPAERRVFVLLASEGDSEQSEIVTRTPEPKRFAALDPGFVSQIIADKQPVILTDDFAPIERLVGLEPVIDRQ